jgi:hypothetical protein
VSEQGPNAAYPINYVVKVTKTARKQGLKLGITDKTRLWIIEEMKLLKHWPEISQNFDYENAFGAIEFKFHEEKHWIRVFVYNDDLRKTMWVIKVMSKKTNALTVADKISIETAVSRMEQDLKTFKKKQSQAQLGLKLVGGKSEQ